MGAVRVPKYYQLKGELLRLIEGAGIRHPVADRTGPRRAVRGVADHGPAGHRGACGRGSAFSDPGQRHLRVGAKLIPSRQQTRSPRTSGSDVATRAVWCWTSPGWRPMRRWPRPWPSPRAPGCSGWSGCGSSATSRSRTRWRAWRVPTRGWRPSWPGAGRSTSPWRGRTRVELTDAEDAIETALASPVEAQLLGVDTGLPMLLIRRTAWADGQPVEHTRSVFRGDRFRFVARHRR